MTIKNPLKRVIAGALAVLVMACSIPANADLGGIFGGTDIVASAEKSEQSETIATNKGEPTYNGTNVTIEAENAGDVDGMILSSGFSATISVADGYKITKVEFTKGWNDINNLSSEAGNVTYSGDVATVSDVNAQSLTVKATQDLQIKQVKVYYEVSAEKSETIATNQRKNTYTGTNVTITAQSVGDSSGMDLRSTNSATISVAEGYIITKAEFTSGFNPIERLSSAAGNVTYSGDVATVSDVNAQSLTVNGTARVNIKQVKVYYVKTKWAIGENVNLNGKWVSNDDTGKIRTYVNSSTATVPTPSYSSRYSQWFFNGFMSYDKYSYSSAGSIIDYIDNGPLYLTPPSGKTSADKPSGFKIKSGSGTQADPYTFELVYPSKVDVTGVSLDKTAVTIPYGGTEPLTLTANVDPDDAADKTVTWASSDTTVATVDKDGAVTPVKAGTAAITATATNGTADDTTDDKTATCTVTVSKIDPNLKTAPAAIEGLTYNGEPQELITAGTSDDGTVQYAVVETDDDTPEYTLVKRDSPDELDLTDVKVNTIYTPDLEGEYKGLKGIKFSSSANYIIDDITYTGSIRLCYSTDLSKYYLMSNKGTSPLPEGIDGLLITDIDSGNIYAELVNTANPVVEPQIDEQAWVEVIPKETDAGEYDVYYRVKGDDNHNNTKPVKIEGTKIGKGAPTLTDPKAVEGLVDDGTAKKLVTEGSTEDGQLQYALGTDAQTEPESSTFGADVPEMTKAGTYYVWYRVIGDTNHTDSQAKCITVTISEKKSDDSSKSDSSKSDSSKTDSNSGGSNDGANDSSTTPDTGFNGSVTGAAATLMGAAVLAAVSVIAAKKKKEDK